MSTWTKNKQATILDSASLDQVQDRPWIKSRTGLVRDEGSGSFQANVIPLIPRIALLCFDPLMTPCIDG